MSEKLAQPTVEQPLGSDRFKKLSDNYTIMGEVFTEQGIDYRQFENSVFENVNKFKPACQKTPILDIGIGEGETCVSFLNAGCTKITGIDLNREMLKKARERLGNAVTLVEMDATHIGFKAQEFPIVISGNAIHNIPREVRKLFWQELLRLSPDLFVCLEKIADADPDKHKQSYNTAVNAIKKIYGQKYSLTDTEKEWLDHYEYDEKESLDLAEIIENIGTAYDIGVAEEFGLYKTITATKKIDSIE